MGSEIHSCLDRATKRSNQAPQIAAKVVAGSMNSQTSRYQVVCSLMWGRYLKLTLNYHGIERSGKYRLKEF